MSYLDDDGNVEVIAIEDPAQGHHQSLWVRVGPVFYGDGQSREPGVWVCYQQAHMAGPLAGPVLLSPQTWRELNRAVERRLRRGLPLWKRLVSCLVYP